MGLCQKPRGVTQRRYSTPRQCEQAEKTISVLENVQSDPSSAHIKGFYISMSQAEFKPQCVRAEVSFNVLWGLYFFSHLPRECRSFNGEKQSSV